MKCNKLLYSFDSEHEYSDIPYDGKILYRFYTVCQPPGMQKQCLQALHFLFRHEASFCDAFVFAPCLLCRSLPML